jgi:hypothetical protein
MRMDWSWHQATPTVRPNVTVTTRALHQSKPPCRITHSIRVYRVIQSSLLHAYRGSSETLSTRRHVPKECTHWGCSCGGQIGFHDVRSIRIVLCSWVAPRGKDGKNWWFRLWAERGSHYGPSYSNVPSQRHRSFIVMRSLCPGMTSDQRFHFGVTFEVSTAVTTKNVVL